MSRYYLIVQDGDPYGGHMHIEVAYCTPDRVEDIAREVLNEYDPGEIDDFTVPPPVTVYELTDEDFADLFGSERAQDLMEEAREDERTEVWLGRVNLDVIDRLREVTSVAYDVESLIEANTPPCIDGKKHEFEARYIYNGLEHRCKRCDWIETVQKNPIERRYTGRLGDKIVYKIIDPY